MATVTHSAGEKRVQQIQNQIHLTPTGLLMEGDYTQNPPGRHFERNGDISSITFQAKQATFTFVVT